MKKLIIDALIFEDKKAYGYQEYLFNLLQYFHDHREDILFDQIIVICDFSQVSLFDKFSGKLQIIGFKANSRANLFVAQNQIGKKLNLNANDIILCTYNYSPFFRQGRYILVIHDLLYLRSHLLPNPLMRLQRKIFVPRSLNKADAVVSISEFTKSDIIRHYRLPEERITVIYNYFNFKKYSHSGNPEVSPVKPYYLSVSSIHPHKNVIVLLKAYNLVNEAWPDCPDLVLVGKKDNMDLNCKAFYESLSDSVSGKVIFKEDINNRELGNLYSACTCFILPTLFEGLGMPIIEALYFSAKLVLSDIPICREIAGENAVYFPPQDDVYLSKILLERSYEKIELQKDQLKKFSAENTSEKYINLINQF